MMIRRSCFSGVVLAALVLFVSRADAGPMIYWTQTEGGSLQRSPLEGTVGVYRIVLQDTPRPWGTVIDYKSRKIYWADGTAAAIKRCNLDGSNVEVVVPKTVEAFGLDIDRQRGKLYWVTCGEERARVMERANLDGSQRERLAWAGNGCFSAVAIDEENQKVYWTTFPDSIIRRANLDGSKVENVYVGAVTTSGIAIDPKNKKLYWSSDDKVITIANLDGSDVKTWREVEGVVMAFAIDHKGGKLYWSLVDEPRRIQRGNLDGTGEVETVIRDGGPAFGIALDLEGGPDKVEAKPAPKAEEKPPAPKP